MYVLSKENNSHRKEKQAEWIERIVRMSKILKDHMGKFGFCVIDNFMDISVYSTIKKEVQGENTTSSKPGIKFLLLQLDGVIKKSAESGFYVGGKKKITRSHVKINR